jgi:hypothetical protein
MDLQLELQQANDQLTAAARAHSAAEAALLEAEREHVAAGDRVKQLEELLRAAARKCAI